MNKTVLAFLLAAVLAVSSILPTASAAENVLRGQAGSDVSGFSSRTIDGTAISGNVFAGYSVSIVTYWATWSGSALMQLEYLHQVHETRPDIGVFGILYTDSTSTAAAAMAYMQAHGYDFPVFTADEVWQGVLSQAAYIPQSFFVSPSGIILEAYPGAFSSADAVLDEAAQWAGEGGRYTVRFYDDLGGTAKLLASYTGVEHGSSVEAPTAPEHAGYRFDGWSSDAYLCVTGDLEIFAAYTCIRPDGDIDGNGEFNSLDAQLLMRVMLGLAPYDPDMIAHGDVDMNGVLDSRDALMMMRILLGIIV